MAPGAQDPENTSAMLNSSHGTRTGPTHSTLDELAEQLESELQLCDISLNQLIRGSKMAASTRGTSSSPALRASSASTQYAAASSRTQPLPALSPRKSAAAANKTIAVAPAPTDTSLVKRLVTATGQGCQAILAPDLSRQPIPGVCWTTRTSRGGTPRSSCTLLLKHAASTDLLVRLTAAEGASVPRRVLLSTAPKPSARFEVLGEVELAAGSARHLRHVFRLAPGTIAGRNPASPLAAGGLPAHRITNLLVTGRSIDSPGPATGEAGIVPLQAQARASDDAPSFFSCAGLATGPTSALSQRSRDEASVAAGRGTKFGGGVAQRVLAEELEGEDRGERRMQGAAEWGDPELLEEASALSAPGTAGAPNEQQAHDACLDRAWRHFETRAADVARGASALVRAGREVQDCTGLAWIAGAARGAAGFLFRQGGAGAAEAVAALLKLRAIKSTRPGCSTLLHFLAREAASASGAEPRTLVGQLGHCREAADVDPADLQAGVQALRDLLEEEVVAALHAAEPCSRAHEEWRAFRSDASEALAELEASVAKALLAYRDACETIAGGASASAPPAPASFFPALLEFAGEADAALAECLAGASQAGSRGPGKASAASSAASLRQTVWASRGVVSSAASAARSGGASRGSRKRPASRDLSAPSASVSLEGGIGGPGDDGALGQTGSAVAALTGAASSGGPPHSALGSATLSPHVAALLAESDRLLRFSLGGRGQLTCGFRTVCRGRAENARFFLGAMLPIRKLTAGLQPVTLKLTNESHKHAGHTGNPTGAPDAETHFNVEIVSEAFQGKPLVARHRLVYTLLKEELDAGLHALALKTKTPSEVAR
ncbi:SufE-like protein, chloroplastic [Auxenochlorella protothecoides]|uniref:SufE-like protein, chloroplastic n=1 Tax=Auxenochlorella protothecoides TaxID=3075 RepID=A0A087SQX5_AUXPR|nr:SufE-like protein, chloroplastic [Auxenochlorella protothecoides]KFM28129.1 SufE-like protein, chloroplastic [Auxenochlorella protothecoides]